MIILCLRLMWPDPPDILWGHLASYIREVEVSWSRSPESFVISSMLTNYSSSEQLNRWGAAVLPLTPPLIESVSAFCGSGLSGSTDARPGHWTFQHCCVNWSIGDSYCIKSFLIFLTAKVSSSTTYQINLSVCLFVCLSVTTLTFFFQKVHWPIRAQFETNWPIRGQY